MHKKPLIQNLRLLLNLNTRNVTTTKTGFRLMNMSFNSQLKKMPVLSFQMLRSLQIIQIASGSTAIPLKAQMDLQPVLDLKILAISGILRLPLMLALMRVSFLILTQ